jgi:hypothetical protein
MLNEHYRTLERIASHGWYDDKAGTGSLVTWSVQVADGDAEHDDEFDYICGKAAFLKLTERGYGLLHSHLTHRFNLKFANERMAGHAKMRKTTRERRFEIATVHKWLEDGMVEGEINIKLAELRKVRKEEIAWHPTTKP